LDGKQEGFAARVLSPAGVAGGLLSFIVAKYSDHTKLLEICLRQLGQDIGVDFTRAKERLVLSEAKTSEPTPDIRPPTNLPRRRGAPFGKGGARLLTAFSTERPHARRARFWYSGGALRSWAASRSTEASDRCGSNFPVPG
jgi:hypothetical protein